MCNELNKIIDYWGSFGTFINFTCFLTLEVKIKVEMTSNHTDMTCVTILVSYLDVDIHFSMSYLSTVSDKIDSINKYI